MPPPYPGTGHGIAPLSSQHSKHAPPYTLTPVSSSRTLPITPIGPLYAATLGSCRTTICCYVRHL
eukprot:509616-Rhodomonas_salina.1